MSSLYDDYHFSPLTIEDVQSDNTSNTSNTSENVCFICLEHINENDNTEPFELNNYDKVLKTCMCGGFVHEYCYIRWVSQNNSCPICTKSVFILNDIVINDTSGNEILRHDLYNRAEIVYDKNSLRICLFIAIVFVFAFLGSYFGLFN
tara:strand:+ start:78 stop:521 length:444 start_codon:yes stop_codon:yes gene_type:complete